MHSTSGSFLTYTTSTQPECQSDVRFITLLYVICQVVDGQWKFIDNKDDTYSQLDVIYLMQAKNTKLTVEAVQYFEIKNSRNATSVPPILTKSREVYLFFNGNSSKSGSPSN